MVAISQGDVLGSDELSRERNELKQKCEPLSEAILKLKLNWPY